MWTSLTALVEAFLLEKGTEGRSPSTLHKYGKRWLYPFAQAMGDTLDKVTPLEIRRHFGRLHERGLAPSTIHQGY
jgi:hypothetical protein